MQKITEYTTRKDGTPIVRVTLIDDKGTQVQVVESADGSPPIVSVLPADWKHSIIKGSIK